MKYNKGICQNCGKKFKEMWCFKDKIGSKKVFICPHCKHGNCSDNTSSKNSLTPHKDITTQFN